MTRKYPLAMHAFIRSVQGPLRIVRHDIRKYGPEQAYRMFMERSVAWLSEHQTGGSGEAEEIIATQAFSAALCFINILFATGEVFDDAEVD
jgi:hypothetical protein